MFTGFNEPKENWSKMPNEFIDALPMIETIGEMKVILYILRHTWGFHDDEKKITLDEFESGRRRRDRTRLDDGTGLSKPTIIDGLQRAEAHGFICVEIDDRDKARVKKFYSLRMLRNFTPDVKELDSGSKEPLQRSEKETLAKKPKKEPGTAGEKDYLGAVVEFKKTMDKNDDRPRGWRDASDGEYRICERVASLWAGGRLPWAADDIEKHLAASYQILNLFDGDEREALWTIDEFHAEKGADLGYTVSGPYSLRNAIPLYLTEKENGSNQVVRVNI